MSRAEYPDDLIAAFFEQPQPPLPDRVFDGVRAEIHGTRQPTVFGPVRVPVAWAGRGILVAVVTVAAAVVIVAAVAWLSFRPIAGPGSVGSPPAANPSSLPSASSTPARPTVFTSPLYGYTFALPTGWTTTAAVRSWDGRSPTAFGQDDVDSAVGPDLRALMVFAAPFDGDLQAFIHDQVTATARDHAVDCPSGALEVNERISVGGRQGALLGWNCGALINEALTIRDGVAYAFAFRDLGIKAARDPTDLAIFRSILDSVELPATPGSSP